MISCVLAEEPTSAVLLFGVTAIKMEPCTLAFHVDETVSE